MDVRQSVQHFDVPVPYLIVLQHVTVLGNAVIITKIIFHFFISINECTADLYNDMYDFEIL